MRVERDAYIEKLKEKMWNGSVKVITGLRRCGKSFIVFELFKEYLLSNGTKEDEIVSVDLDNIANAKLTTLKNGLRVINIAGGETLMYENLPYPDGEYQFLLKQDKVKVIFNKKMAKTLGKEFVPPFPGQTLTVSCYDEEPQQHLNTIFVKIKGFDEYVTLLIDNEFSVYKMPQFKVWVPEDGFELI